jgi:hypothetical protein
MFIRWHHAKRQDGSLYLNAALVETIQVKGKSARQKHLTALAGIAEADAKSNPEASQKFWDKALARIKAQKVSKAEQQTVIAALLKRVPRPSPQQLKEQRLRELERSLAKAEQEVGRIKGQMRTVRGWV